MKTQERPLKAVAVKARAATVAKTRAKAGNGKPASAPNPNFVAWNTGNYLTVGAAFQLMAELLCEAVELRPGQRVLDVAGGTGNVAIAAARRWCRVTGTDLIPYMVEAARARARAEGLESIDFQVADAHQLPFDDESFDVVLSSVGVMFAPRQEKAAAELLRVCRPGGKVGLTCWTPTSSVAQMSMAMGKHLPPPPPGFMPPVAWGHEQRLRQLFGDRAARMHLTLRTHWFRHPTPASYVDYVKENYGPTALAFKMLPKEAAAKASEDLVRLVSAANISGDATLLVPGEYAEIVIVKA